MVQWVQSTGSKTLLREKSHWISLRLQWKLTQMELTVQCRGIMHQYVIFVTVQEKRVESTSLKLFLCDGLLRYWYIHGPQRNEPPLTFPSTTIMMLQLKCLQKILDNLTWHVFHSWSPEDDPDCLWDLLPFTCRYLRSWVECSENFWMNCHEIVVQRFMFSWGYTGRASVTPLKSTICSISALKCNLLSCLPTSNPEKSIILFKVTGSFTWLHVASSHDRTLLQNIIKVKSKT